MSDPAWEEYLAATRRLDALRRGAVTAEDEPGRVATATFEELTRVRVRLAEQRIRLRMLGVPEEELHPSSDELAAARARDGDPVAHPTGTADGADGGSAAAFTTDGPGMIWAALRRSRALADQADAALAPPRGWAALRVWARRLVGRRRRFRNAG